MLDPKPSSQAPVKCIVGNLYVHELRSFKMGVDLDRWLEIAKDCKYLPENDFKVSTARWIIL